jgi:ElaB/YqjD/DUF883 family membrane-anchored ribosome-binding protein
MIEDVDGAEVLLRTVAELEAEELANVRSRATAKLDRERRTVVGYSGDMNENSRSRMREKTYEWQPAQDGA